MRAMRLALTAGLLAVLAGGIGCTRHYAAEATDHVNMANVETKIVTQLTGDQVQPSVASNARGVATFYIMKDGTVRYELITDDIEGVTAAELHAGDARQVGPPIARLYAPDQPTGKVNGVLIRDAIEPEEFQGDYRNRTVADLAHDLRAGRVYVVIKTTAHPSGEIRGDIPLRQ